MAKKELAGFCSEYLPAHAELRANLGAITHEKQLAKAMVDAGKKAGFDFDENDIREAMGPAAQTSGELSENQLEAVAGGRKAGEKPMEYLVVKLNEVYITGTT